MFARYKLFLLKSHMDGIIHHRSIFSFCVPTNHSLVPINVNSQNYKRKVPNAIIQHQQQCNMSMEAPTVKSSMILDLHCEPYLSMEQIPLLAMSLKKIVQNNKESQHPFQIIFSGVRENSQLASELQKINRREKTFSVANHVEIRPESFTSMHDVKHQPSLYLSRLSKDVLNPSELNVPTVLVINPMYSGAFRHDEGLKEAHQNAIASGIRHARLPYIKWVDDKFEELVSYAMHINLAGNYVNALQEAVKDPHKKALLQFAHSCTKERLMKFFELCHSQDLIGSKHFKYCNRILKRRTQLGAIGWLYSNIPPHKLAAITEVMQQLNNQKEDKFKSDTEPAECPEKQSTTLKITINFLLS